MSSSEDDRRHLATSTTHALRHTFGTQAVAAIVPPDVAQKVLGHASLVTTTIYAQAETRRARRELSGYYERDSLVEPEKTNGVPAKKSGVCASP